MLKERLVTSANETIPNWERKERMDGRRYSRDDGKGLEKKTKH